MATRKTSSKTTKKSAKAPSEPVVIPPYPGISEQKLQALAAKIDKAKDSYRISDMILAVNGNEWRSRHTIAWHLAACRAIHPETNPSILEFLGDDLETTPPEVLVDTLVNLPDASAKKYYANTSLLLDGYSLTIDRILSLVYRSAPEVVQAREGEFNKSLRLGLSFVRRLLGETITAKDSSAILQQIVKHQTRDYGLTRNTDLLVREGDQIVKFTLADLSAIRKLALYFGTEKEWEELFLAAALERKWQQPKEVHDAFVLASTSQLADLVNSSSIDTGETLRTILQVIPLRNDDPQALLDAALTVTDSATMREMLLMGVIYRAGKMGVDVPEQLAEHLKFDLLDATYEGVRAGCIEWFKNYPREKALEAARKLLNEEYSYSRAVGILAVFFDENILRAALEKDLGNNYISSETLGALGAAGLPLLEWAYDKSEGESLRKTHRAILFAMGTAAQTSTLEERWDRFIDFDSDGGHPIPYYGSSDVRPREAALHGIPEPRLSALLLKCLENTKHPDRILQMAHLAKDPAIVDVTIRKIVQGRVLESSFRECMDRLGEPAIEALCKHIGLSKGDGRFLESLQQRVTHTVYKRVEEALQKAGIRKESPRDALVRMAAEGPEPKMRIYVLQVEKDGYDPKEGTISRSGGKAPGIADSDLPKDKSGEPLTHLFTLDLDEIPELQKDYSGARALAVFCPEPNSGDRSEEIELVPVTREAVEALPHKNVDEDDDDEGRPICILPLDVPASVFDRKTEDAASKEIRKIVFNSAGHVFGEPFWIQGDDDEGVDFILQINEGLCDVNLGDCGSLYVFESGTVFQCY